MSCIPFLYGVGAGVAMRRGYWPPPTIPPVACPPPQPQRPPQQPPPNLPPDPPPPRASVQISHFLCFPPLVGVNVEVFEAVYETPGSDPTYSSKILPSLKPIALRYRTLLYNPVNPTIFATMINPLIHTGLRPRTDRLGVVMIRGDQILPFTSGRFIVAQLLFHNQRWIVAIHQVSFPSTPQPQHATLEDYRLAIENRREQLVMFYDSALQGLGPVSYSPITIDLTPKTAIIRSLFAIRPTSSPAYCMYIHRVM